MPIFLFIAILVIFAVCIAFILVGKGKQTWLKKRVADIVVFVLCLISLIISVSSFSNIARYVSEYNASPTQIYGGEFGLYMAWLELIVLFMLFLITGLRLFWILRKNVTEKGR